MFLKCASIVAVVLAAGEASAASYSVIVLQDVGGGNNSVAYGINASDQIVGYSLAVSGQDAAVLWSPNGSGKALQDVGGAGASFAHGINASGQIVGQSETLMAGGGQDAVLWSPNGSGKALQDVGGAGVSFAHGINASGLFAGAAIQRTGRRPEALIPRAWLLPSPPTSWSAVPVPVAADQRTASTPKLAVNENPTIWPEALIPKAWLWRSPPTSWSAVPVPVAADHRTASVAEADSDSPTIWPEALISTAPLELVPPTSWSAVPVPVAADHRTASAPLPAADCPTIFVGLLLGQFLGQLTLLGFLREDAHPPAWEILHDQGDIVGWGNSRQFALSSARGLRGNTSRNAWDRWASCRER
jgi:hypothetical protein